MKRPLLFILLFLVLGILTAYFIENNIVILVIFSFIFLLSIYFLKIYRINLCKYLIIFSFIGFLLMLYAKNEPIKQMDIIINNKEEISIIGSIKNLQIIDKDRCKFILKVDNITLNNKTLNKRLSLMVYTEYKNGLQDGIKVNVKGNISNANKKSNPNAYDERLNYKIKNIDYKMYAKNIEMIGYNKIEYYIGKLNKNIGIIYDKILPYRESSLLKAMLLGDKEYLDEDMINLYRNAGIYHILAISGLHIGILSLFLTNIFDKINKRYGKIIVIFILIFYCIFTGSSLSTYKSYNYEYNSFNRIYYI